VWTFCVGFWEEVMAEEEKKPETVEDKGTEATLQKADASEEQKESKTEETAGEA